MTEDFQKLKKSFIIYKDALKVLDELSDEEAGKLFKAIKLYQLEGKIELEGLLKAIFVPFKTMFDENNAVYENVCKRNRENGLKGGRPKTQTNPKNPVGFSETQANPKNLDNDNDNDNDNDINNNIIVIGEKLKNKKFVVPSIEEIKNYCKERNNNINAEYFFNYNSARGWMIGKNKMKDWKAAIRTWEAREKTKKQTTNTIEQPMTTKELLEQMRKERATWT